jgi:DNA-directed RNA polymerase subunit RPC12/RpoP
MSSSEQTKKMVDSCPHCGHKLSQWQQVILNVDRVLMCKNCWYRIILDVVPNEEEKKNQQDNEGKDN